MIVISHLILASCYVFQNRFKCTHCEETFETHLELYDHYRWIVSLSCCSRGYMDIFCGTTLYSTRLYISSQKGMNNFNNYRDISFSEPTRTRTTSARDVEPVSTNWLSFHNTGSRRISPRCGISAAPVVRDLSLKISWRGTWKSTVSFPLVYLFTKSQLISTELCIF